MGILLNLIEAVIHLTAAAMDILLFFILVRTICYKWSNPLIAAFNSAGILLTDWFTSFIQKQLRRLTGTSFSSEAALLTGMFMLLAFRIFIAALFIR